MKFSVGVRASIHRIGEYGMDGGVSRGHPPNLALHMLPRGEGKTLAAGIRGFLKRPCISSLAWFDLQRGPAVFRGRKRETFSESRMR